jgi:hypothetical protein
MRYVSLAIAALFTWIACLQLGYGDKLWWISLYMIPAGISLLVYQKKFPRELSTLLSLLYFCYALYLATNLSNFEGLLNKQKPIDWYDQELLRKAKGAGFCGSILFVYVLADLISKRKASRADTPQFQETNNQESQKNAINRK